MREIENKPSGTGRFEEYPEEDEEEDVGEHHAQRDTEDALTVEKRLRDNPRHGISTVGKKPRGEDRSKRRVEQEYDGEDR